MTARKAPSPKRRARELVQAYDHGLWIGGVLCGDWNSAARIRRILAREFRRAADARARRELRKAAGMLRRYACTNSTPPWPEMYEAARMVEALAAPKRKRAPSDAVLDAIGKIARSPEGRARIDAAMKRAAKEAERFRADLDMVVRGKRARRAG